MRKTRSGRKSRTPKEAKSSAPYQAEGGPDKSSIQPALIFFAAGVLGILLGFLMTKFLSIYVLLIVAVFLAIFVSGLFSAWIIKNSLHGEGVAEKYEEDDILVRRHNAYTLIIEELEYNLMLTRGANLAAHNWQALRLELDLFPPFLFDKLVSTYSGLAGAIRMEEPEYQNYLTEKLGLPLFLGELKEKQRFILENL